MPWIECRAAYESPAPSSPDIPDPAAADDFREARLVPFDKSDGERPGQKFRGDEIEDDVRSRRRRIRGMQICPAS